MNQINLQCSGNFLTKPLMCYSILDAILMIVVFGLSLLIGMYIVDKVSKIKKEKKTFDK
jgi:uncharacterized membrane protein